MGALTITPEQQDWTIEQLQALELVEVPTADLRRFLHNCQVTQLDPFTRQIYMIGRYDNRRQQTVYAVQASIDGLRIVAQRSHEYEGQTDMEWADDHGIWHDVWLSPDKPVAARAGVWRKGFRQALKAAALWREYGGNTNNWRTMPVHMLAKVAEALALRKAFPHDLSGIYIAEEMDQADTGQDSSPKPPETTETPTSPEAAEIAAEAQQARIDEVVAELGRCQDRKGLAAVWFKAGSYKLLDTEIEGEGKFRDLWQKVKVTVDGLGEAPAGEDGKPAVAPDPEGQPWATAYLPNGEIDLVESLRNKVNWENAQKQANETVEPTEDEAKAAVIAKLDATEDEQARDEQWRQGQAAEGQAAAEAEQAHS